MDRGILQLFGTNVNLSKAVCREHEPVLQLKGQGRKQWPIVKLVLLEVVGTNVDFNMMACSVHETGL